MTHRITPIALAIALALLVGYSLLPAFAQGPDPDDHAHAHREVREHVNQFKGIQQAVAVLHPTEGNDVRGVVHFREHDGQVTVTAEVRGLEPNSTHGFHIHEFGDCTAPDATSAGGHYNPEGHPHALPDGEQRHAGDLGNLEANDQGVATLELTVDNITVAGLENPILGRGLIVHAQRDTGAQPTGEAGARMACGVIGIANPGGE